jgi:hypothetical protein
VVQYRCVVKDNGLGACKVTNIPYIFDATSFDSEPCLGGLPFCAVEGKDFDKVLSLKNMFIVIFIVAPCILKIH